MAATGQKRLTKELCDLQKSPPEATTVSLLSDSDLYTWAITLTGPPNTPFSSGLFHLTLTFPHTYPFSAPTLSFKTKILHPNVSSDGKGLMCLGILKAESWKPSMRIEAVLRAARELLIEPNVEDAVETSVAELMARDRGAWEKKAREWTELYARS
ncbi:MAG: hypothetical protein M1834_000624 [Cirrosporium novae-zelandiae]|nr:MAG: hypothetical protein M1834_000624 [Cirrosporium novae-zelandiae]